PSSSATRAYECLSLRYVSGLTVEEVARELYVSPRQVYRDLRWGEQRLTEWLRARPATPAEHPDRAARGCQSALADEIGSLEFQARPVDLAHIVATAVAALAALSERVQVPLRYQGPSSGVVVRAAPGLLEEMVTQLASGAVQSAEAQDIEVSLTTTDNEAILRLTVPRPDAMTRRDLIEAALQIADHQGLRYRFAEDQRGPHLAIVVPLCPRLKALVVEDNPGAYDLYERYLAQTEWDPELLVHPRLAVDMAALKAARAVILDVMMPETSGWTILRALKLDPRTRDIPVIVCSVINDPELAYALGASGYLTKPVSRLQLLQALREALPEDTEAAPPAGNSE
ncbi:MAG: response regulator, partial [Anaerolineae bacterium]